MRQRLFSGYLISVNELLHIRMVNGELLDAFLVNKVRSRVPDMRDGYRGVLYQRPNDGGPHLLETLTLAAKHDRSVGFLAGVSQRFNNVPVMFGR
jgi:hypothetical protein